MKRRFHGIVTRLPKIIRFDMGRVSTSTRLYQKVGYTGEVKSLHILNNSFADHHHDIIRPGRTSICEATSGVV